MVPKITSMINEELSKPITREEIRKTALRAPGPDGLTGMFFKKYWTIVGDDVWTAIEQFFAGGILPESVNYILLSLIPKVNQVKSMKDLRPIGLCSVFYKIIAKVLTIRLQPFMGDIISSEKSAFMQGRFISDNILICHEVTHYLRTRKRSRNYSLALKLDTSKAYEYVDWAFLEHMMNCLGFKRQWITWILSYITSVTYFLQVNGHRVGHIQPIPLSLPFPALCWRIVTFNRPLLSPRYLYS